VDLGISVVAGSVDDEAATQRLAEGLRIGYVTMVCQLDAEKVAADTGARIQRGDRTFLHATGFLLDPQGSIVQSVYASGPIGRFTANDILKKVRFDQHRQRPGR
jgi:hypothetical protein